MRWVDRDIHSGHPAEMSGFGPCWGQDSKVGVGGEATGIEREVLRRLALGMRPELIRLPLGDVLERRKPRL